MWNPKIQEGKFLLGNCCVCLLDILRNVSLSNCRGFILPILIPVQEISQGQCVSRAGTLTLPEERGMVQTFGSSDLGS